MPMWSGSYGAMQCRGEILSHETGDELLMLLLPW